MSIQLVWFRTDLRIDDNTALMQAVKAGPTIAIYIATPRQWQEHNDAPIKMDFWRRNLQCLAENLKELNIPLCFFQVPVYADIPQLMQEIISDWNADALHCNTEYPLNEVKRDKAVKALCQKLGVAFNGYEDQCLLPPDFVLTGDGQPFKVFTPFSKKCLLLLDPMGSSGSTAARQVKTMEADNLNFPLLDSQLNLPEISWPDPELWWQQQWPAGEQEARQRLNAFIETRIEDYKSARDMPALNGTSSLSPYLASGVMSVRSCWQSASVKGDGESAQAWRNELLWRDFYKYVMHHYPHVSMNRAWNSKYDSIPWRDDQEDFQRWCHGETGFPLIDAAMKQLQQCGWMHNRLRMVVAMFLSKNLLLDWRWGERWFMQHLIDGDFSANNGGWQWSASTGTDAAPYFRLFNPIRQSERFDAEGEFIRSYLPELSGESKHTIHDPAKITANYIAPMIDLKYSRDRCLAAFKENQ